MAIEQEQGISVLNAAIKACTEIIESKKGKLAVKEAPRAVSFCFSNCDCRTDISTNKMQVSAVAFLICTAKLLPPLLGNKLYPKDAFACWFKCYDKTFKLTS